MKLDKNLLEFIALLNSARVEFLIVGGHAVGFHGHPRYTGDIDLFIPTRSETASAVIQALGAFGFGGLGLSEQDFLAADSVIQLGYPPNRIDLLTGIEGVDFDQAWATRVAANIDGIPVHFISRDMLLKNKRAAARPQDLADAAALDPNPNHP